MREALLLLVAMAVFVGLVFAPGGAGDNAAELFAPPPQVVAQTSNDTEAGKDYSAWVAGTTTLPRAADGHFYADARVNGTPVRFLVDTGASTIALTGRDAAAMGLAWDPAAVTVVAQGASGPVYGVTVMLDRVELGHHSATQVPAMVIPEGLGISLLGQSFLSTVPAVKMAGETMVLGAH